MAKTQQTPSPMMQRYHDRYARYVRKQAALRQATAQK